MKAWLVVAGALLLAGCGRKEDMGEHRAKDTPVAETPILNQQADHDEPANVTDAPAPQPAPERVSTAPLSNETRYRALGTEPFWAVTVKGSVATLERPDKAPVHVSVNRTDDGRAVRYLADGFSMTVTDGPCNDGMSDAHWADRVALSFGEGTLKGCGGVREDF